MNSPSANGTSKEMVLLVATIGSFVFPLGLSAVTVAIPTIGRELSLDAIMLGWISTSYLLSSAAVVIPFGRIADIYGRKRIFVWGAVTSTVSSLLLALTNSANMLIACRVFQGIGGAMYGGSGIALLTTVYPANERGRVLGINVAATYMALSLGPVLGGVLTHRLGWRSIFFLTAFLGLVVAGLTLRKLKGDWIGARGERFDLAGSAIYVLSLVTLVYGFTLLPAMAGLWLIIAGIAGLWGFVRREIRITSPVLDMGLFKNSKTFTLSNLAALIHYSATWAVSFLVSLYLQYLKGFNPETAGLILVCMPAMQAIFSPLAGRLSDRIEPRLIASAGMALTMIGIIIFAFVNEKTSLELIIGNLLLMGLGFAFFSSPNTNAVMSSAPKAAYGVASATLATMRQVGMVLSMGVTMLMFALYIGRVQITPDKYPAFQESMRASFIICAILCFAGIFASLARGKVR